MKLLILASMVFLAKAHSPVLLWPAESYHLPEGQSVLEMMAMEDFQKLFQDKKVVIFHKRTFGLEEVSYPSKPLAYLQTVNAFALQGVKSIHRLLSSLTTSENLKFVTLEDGDLSEQQDLMKKTMDNNPGFSAILVGSGSHHLSRRAAGDPPKAACEMRGDDKNCMVYIEAVTKGEKTPLTCTIDCPEEGKVTITIDNITLNVQPDNYGFNISTTKGYKLDTETLWAPKEFSYSCGELRILGAKETDTITVKGLQIWPVKGKSTFPESYDCATWFSSVLWMGVLIVFFYIFILLGAVLYLLDVKTNDRFDDPKGKTITVNVSE